MTNLTQGGLILHKPDVPTELRAFENLQNMSQSQNQRVGFTYLGLKMTNMTDYDRLVAHGLNLEVTDKPCFKGLYNRQLEDVYRNVEMGGVLVCCKNKRGGNMLLTCPSGLPWWCSG